ncbi:MAG: polyprenyl synthetase family protein [Actinomycetota bacterium]|nr:polyprenyl synthetase family protein [Actinomycetota bacterium]
MSTRSGVGGRRAVSSIQAVLDAGGAPASRLIGRLEARMTELATGHGEPLASYAGDTLSAGGKRLRPLLVFLAAGAPPPETDGLLRAAVAVELVHSATLVHDDVLDGSPLRRGRPTVLAAAGRRMATATGDLLLSRAFHELAAGGSLPSVRTLSRASTALAAGELMQRADAWQAVAVARYLERCRLKTGVLFRAACELGAINGQGPVQTLGAFGETIGIAFQLLDDILDVTGPPERTGKPRGADLLDGTVTLPLLLARGRSVALAALDPRSVDSDERAAEVCDQIAATGALEVARRHALELIAQAKGQLPVLEASQRGALELVADGVVERYA